MAAINIYVQVSVCTYIVISLGTIPRSGTAGSYGDSMFISLRKCQTVSQIDASFYFLTRAIYRSQLFPFLANTSYLIFFFNSSHPSWLKLYLTGVLICISLMTGAVEYLFTHALATCVSSLEKYIFRSFSHFLSWVICCFFF